MEISLKILVISALFLCRPAIAQEQTAWQFDSIRANSNISKPDAQQMHEIMLKNARPLERPRHRGITWRPTGNRPNCSVVVDSEQFNGWQQLHDSYVNGYPNRVAMGFIQPERIQVKLLKSDLALALTWWSASFPTSHRTVVGTSTMNLQKFDDGWKIVASHTSISEL